MKIDSREPPELKGLLMARSALAEVEALPYGDFHLTMHPDKTVAISRKTVDDFLNSFSSGHLQDELIKCSIAQVTVLLIEGHLTSSTIRGFSPLAIRNFLRSMQLQGILLERTDSMRDTADKLFEWEQYLAKTHHWAITARPRAAADMRTASITWVGGIGNQLATNLLQHFGSIHAVVNASVEELAIVHGIGLRKAQELNKQFRIADVKRE